MLSYQILGFIIVLLLSGILYFVYILKKNEQIKQQMQKELEGLEKELSKKNLELENLNSYIKSFTYYDELTTLLNRRKFFEMATTEFAQSKRYKKSLSLIMLDLDFFKQVNDTYGHERGDTILKEFSKILKESVRDCDFVARYGGEEFIIMLPSTDIDNATILLQRIMKKIHAHEYEVAEDKKIQIHASFGLVELSNEQIDINSFIRSADVALKRAKQAGRDCFIVYKKGMD